MRWFLMSLLLCLMGSTLSAQQQRLEGVVSDARTGSPLGGALVAAGDTDVTVVTDIEGRFGLSLSPGSYSLTVSMVGYNVARRDVNVTAGPTLPPLTIQLSEGAGTFEELVRVGATSDESPNVQALYGRELQALRGITLDDPLRALHALPSVSATDDFYSEFAVRGNGFDQIGLAVDGIPAPYLMHSVYGVSDGGSIAMINSDAVAGMSLFPGSYPQQYGRKLGAYADLTLREGNRERISGRGGLSGTSAAAMAEGPIASGRGSWLLSARKSYLDLLLKRIDPDANLAFGFTDAQAKVVFDLTPANHLQVLAIGGRSAFNEAPEDLSVNDEARIRGRSWLGALTWRFTPSSRVSVTQRIYSTGLSYRNDNFNGETLNTFRAANAGWRTDAMIAPLSWFDVRVGADAQRMTNAATHARSADRATLSTIDDYRAAAPAASAYAMASVRRGTAWTISPGVRVDYWGPTRTTAASPWLNAEARLSPGTRVHGGIGDYRQFADLDRIYGIRGGAATLSPQASRHIDAGVTQEIRLGTRLQVTWFNRTESDVLWRSAAEPRRRADGTIQFGDELAPWSNALDGRARGVEVLLRRDRPSGLSGWAGYAFNRVRYRDLATAEEFPGDHDQRHALSLYGQYRISNRTSLNGKFRYGSNYPIRGYIVEDESAANGPSLFSGGPVLFRTLGTERNSLRLPVYARLDVRLDRTFTVGGKRATLFLEVANILNRTNFRNVPYGVDSRGRVLGGTDTLLPLMPSAGFVVEF